MKKKVEKKLYNLMFGEFSALIMFAFIWVIYIYILDKFDHYLTSMQNIYAFILLEFILLQGSIYWYLKWRKVKDNKSYNLSDSQLYIFLWLRRINVFLLCLGFIIFLKNTNYSPINFNGFYLFLYCFALIEYINYYHLRLSYQTPQEIKEFLRQKGLRRSILARELSNIGK
ncbi:hypothetical protein [Peribacillus sp. R9-11]|uniref:hypothetical protein n=1 Tax=Peribacillus sp. R9-11 TaxID=3073271 RepID=UPI00286976EA|nr:hypothetical protein [Peribacillus sp. R9-11]WMX53821.1 hypothetical protein RE409_17225 [Peribacillus sp. R9-11]